MAENKTKQSLTNGMIVCLLQNITKRRQCRDTVFFSIVVCKMMYQYYKL